MAGLGYFIGGIPQGIETGVRLGLLRKESERKSKELTMLEEFRNISMDSKVLENFMKVADKSIDPEALQLYFDGINFKNPNSKKIGQAYLSANVSQKKATQGFLKNISNVLSNSDTPDTRDKAMSALNKLGATVGTDNNAYTAAKDYIEYIEKKGIKENERDIATVADILLSNMGKGRGWKPSQIGRVGLSAPNEDINKLAEIKKGNISAFGEGVKRAIAMAEASGNAGKAMAPTLITGVGPKRQPIRVPDVAGAKVYYGKPATSTAAPKAGQNWILPDHSTVISYDGGRTYVSLAGQNVRMPPTAVKIPGGATLSELHLSEAKRQVAGETGNAPLPMGNAPLPKGIGMSPKEAALAGTGPYSQLAAAFDALAGGFGLDALIGKNGFFPKEADAKQYLRAVRQMTKTALMHGARKNIVEIQRSDELLPDPDGTFTNPAIEARKFDNLADIIATEKYYNNQAIMKAITPQEAEKYRASNAEFDKLLFFITNPVRKKTTPGYYKTTPGYYKKTTPGKITPSESELIKKYLRKK